MRDRNLLLRRIDLRALTEEAGAVFDRGGRSVCPLHPGADNPGAFGLYTGRDGLQRWHCFTRCPQEANNGDAIAFYMRWRGVDFSSALRELVRRAGVPPSSRPCGTVRPAQRSVDGTVRPAQRSVDGTVRPAQRSVDGTDSAQSAWQCRAQAFVRYAQAQLWSPAGAPALDYLRRERGLNDETLRTWGLGYNPYDDWQATAAWGLGAGGKVWCPRGVVIPIARDGLLWNVKVRRPLPGDPLAVAIGPVHRLPLVKFSALRGGQATLFGASRLAGLPMLLWAKGSSMRCWPGRAPATCATWPAWAAQGGAWRGSTPPP